MNPLTGLAGECIPDRECRNISVITTDECQPKNPRNWPDPECPYGLILGADDQAVFSVTYHKKSNIYHFYVNYPGMENSRQ
jgi:hypothetical protein